MSTAPASASGAAQATPEAGAPAPVREQAGPPAQAAPRSPLGPSFDSVTPVPVAAPPPAPAVRIEGVSKRFGAGPVVLDDVSLDIAPGEFVCLLGASGCGKSTLLNLIADLDKPTAGRIETPAEGAAVMFQESALMPWLTARRNVELALRLRGVPRGERREKALSLLDAVNLADAAEKRPHELSGGMRQRVALARALAQDRPVLLMDEPFAALDAITRDLLHEELERVWRATGRTIVFVTHNVREAARLGQRVVLMGSRPGRIVQEWTIAKTTGRRIESPEVAALSVEITDQLRKEIRRNAA
jgi:NitT/TauT family transport system ATP-binding protein